MVTPKLCDVSEVRPYLYLSGFGCITEKIVKIPVEEREVKLRDLGITHIIDATNLPHNPHYEGIEFLHIMVDDSLIANLTPHFGNAAQFIRNAQKKVL
ncbi:hypothetical protein WUBG_07032 [Wuchereria bancrofti]|uniref:Dual specificity protein phosphatase n=1 Tax=Wuchereria bancrofti TaxID=6293 RepID=J9EY05_WUCBA|nr:hypothetical protein WUBG_07032 [Wuchereria bancrofti]